MVTVFHDSIYTCVAWQLLGILEEIEEKINFGGTILTKSTEDAITDCLKEENPHWNEVYRITNSNLEQEKIYYAKQKTNTENFSHGLSLEAVASFRCKLLGKNPFFMFRLNNRLMNGKPTFVFKMSCTQADLSLFMNCNGTDFLNGEYCFADGTFERCIVFVTLSTFIYVGLLRKLDNT